MIMILGNYFLQIFRTEMNSAFINYLIRGDFQATFRLLQKSFKFP